MSKIPENQLITNYRKFKVKFANGGIRKYEYSRSNKDIFFYYVFDGEEKLGFTRIHIDQTFRDKFPIAESFFDLN